MGITIQLRGDIADNWETRNPLLAQREMALETDTDRFKIGDGINRWNDLPYAGLPGPQGPVAGNIDGGVPVSLYGGTDPIDGGTP